MDFRTIVSFFRYIHVLGVFTDVSDPFHVLFSITYAKWRRVIKNYSLQWTIIVIIPSPKKIPVCAIVNPSRMHPPGRQLGGSSGNLFIATLIIHHPYLFTISALPSLSPSRLSPEKSEIITKTEFNATGGGGGEEMETKFSSLAVRTRPRHHCHQRRFAALEPPEFFLPFFISSLTDRERVWCTAVPAKRVDVVSANARTAASLIKASRHRCTSAARPTCERSARAAPRCRLS